MPLFQTGYSNRGGMLPISEGGKIEAMLPRPEFRFSCARASWPRSNFRGQNRPFGARQPAVRPRLPHVQPLEIRRGIAGVNAVTESLPEIVSALRSAAKAEGKAVPVACGAASVQPPARPRRPPADLGHLPFIIRRDGSWLYQGTPINRKELVCLFSSVLRRGADGTFRLETPAERGLIEVEDAPFLAVELTWTGGGRDQVLSFRTNCDHTVTAGPDHPIRVAHERLTCEIFFSSEVAMAMLGWIVHRQTTQT